MMRRTLPLIALSLFACNGGDEPPPGVNPSMDIPTEWQSRESAIVLRLTDASSTSTPVRRAFGDLFNGDPTDPSSQPIDPMQLLMRGSAKDDAGNWLPPEAGLSVAEALAGTAMEQAAAFKERVIDGGDDFSEEEAVDACGNPMLMTVLTPEAASVVLDDTSEIWPESCASPECEPASGAWDVALGERRYDGMIDMVINILPSVATDPTTPGVWGQLTALFFTRETPGEAMVPLFANMRRIQVNLTNVWELDREYADSIGSREIYRFPHRSRTLGMADIFVYAEGYEHAEDYWALQGLDESRVAFGLEDGMPLGVDFTADLGSDLVRATNRSGLLAQALSDTLNYQIGASLACPGVRESAWVRQGPVEFFLCPDGDVQTCVAVHDMDEGACQFPVEPEAELFDPDPIVFDRIDTLGATVNVPASDLPVYLTSTAPSGTVDVVIDVTEDSALYLKDATAVQAITGPAGPALLPTAVPNEHCTDSGIAKLPVGAEWTPGTYTLTFDLTNSTLLDDEGLGDEPVTDYVTWLYFTNVQAWVPN